MSNNMLDDFQNFLDFNDRIQKMSYTQIAYERYAAISTVKALAAQKEKLQEEIEKELEKIKIFDYFITRKNGNHL